MYSTYNTYSRLPKMYSKKKAVRGGIYNILDFFRREKTHEKFLRFKGGGGRGCFRERNGRGESLDHLWEKKKKKGLLRELMRGVVVVAS